MFYKQTSTYGAYKGARRCGKTASAADKASASGYSQVTLRLPWPPSLNHYKRRARGQDRPFYTKEAKEFIGWVKAHCFKYASGGHFPFPKGVKIRSVVFASPPDNRKRDLDNYLKVVFDAIGMTKIYEDDSQIVEHHHVMLPKVEGGEFYIILQRLREEDLCSTKSEYMTRWGISRR